MKTIKVQTSNGGHTNIAESQIEEFKQSLSGELITPVDDQYESARKLWNGMIEKKPVLIARCTGVKDVIAAINFSKEYNLLFSIRSGGHNVAGTAIAEGGLVVDLSEMRSVTVDPEQRVAHA